MNAKPARESRTIMTDLVLPSDTNHYGTIFGGNVMAYVDKAASIAAMRHARMPVVTASSDSFDFLKPIKCGEAIRVEAFVTRTFHTSMEIFVKVESEDLMTGEVNLTATSYLTFVALGENGRPREVPAVIPETEEERWHFDTAPTRYAMRQQRKQGRVTQQ
ncbi:MAG: acyl-CoA thioesterase [Alicyclobacillus sp.]|nr:acyl-CoA thioesterase [Alicyclobacillus sp.]